MPIRQLPEVLINRIAAGEVVERPASVVKELVENAIDAGASRIVVTTAAGGKSLLRIEDDGHGMDRADLLLSVERHATSKLASDDLDDIRSLGFRGEALASIGSVAELTISSRPADAENGLRIEVRNGVRSGPVPQALNRGTIVEVKNLFANVPARLKFLKTDRGESGAITDVLKRLAMANPSVHFVLNGSDRSASNWPAVTGTGALQARLAQVIGDDFAQNAVTLAHSRHGVVVAGMAGLPTYTRANSLSQFYFVNGRSVRDKVLVGAVRAAYGDYVFRDRFPVVALYIAIDPAEVDVNVHPAKAELRFRDGGAVRSAVIRAIGEGLAAAGFRASSSVADDVLGAFTAPEPQAGVPSSAAFPYRPAQTAAFAGYERVSGSGGSNPFSPGFGEPRIEGLDGPSARVEAEPAPALADYPLGTARAQMFDNFIIAQNGEGLLLVDQHAAHERLVYEAMKEALYARPLAAQILLIPEIVDLPEEDADRIAAQAELLSRFGLGLERFGPGA
ncbi:DNA mismatch repair endonuclease MutL, partial [Devosia sp.]|uniref:DNA mismatch repair endonuclease MutL n=1 Tax=Devosia sp. TaxID=1871048 RepID=UPI002736A211